MRRAVFSDLQRKGLEKRFQIQKYISKPDRKKLAEKLGLKDSQVSYNLLTECLRAWKTRIERGLLKVVLKVDWLKSYLKILMIVF